MKLKDYLKTLLILGAILPSFAFAWQENFNFSGSDERDFSWGIAHFGIGASASVSDTSGNPAIEGPTLSASSVSAHVKAAYHFTYNIPYCTGWAWYDENTGTLICNNGTWESDAGYAYPPDYPPGCFDWSNGYFICSSEPVPYSGTIRVSGSDATPQISAVIGSVTGPGDSADILCPAGSYVFGFAYSSHMYGGEGGAETSAIDEMYCATIPQGLTQNNSYRWNRWGPFADGVHACGPNEYIRGMARASSQGGGGSFSNLSGLACGSFVSQTQPGSTYPTRPPTQGIAGKENEFISGFTVHYHQGGEDTRAPRILFDNYMSRILPPPAPFDLQSNTINGGAGSGGGTGGSGSGSTGDYRAVGAYCADSPQPTLSWSFNDTQTAYQVQIATNQTFSNILVDSGMVPSASHSYTVPANSIQYNRTYYWHVRAWGPRGMSGYSEANQLITPPHRGPLVSFDWAPLRPPRGISTTFTDRSTYFGGSSGAQWSWTFPPRTTILTPPPTGASEKVKFNSDAPKTGHIVTLVARDSDGFACTGSNASGITLTDPVTDFKEVR